MNINEYFVNFVSGSVFELYGKYCSQKTKQEKKPQKNPKTRLLTDCQMRTHKDRIQNFSTARILRSTLCNHICLSVCYFCSQLLSNYDALSPGEDRASSLLVEFRPTAFLATGQVPKVDPLDFLLPVMSAAELQAVCKSLVQPSTCSC